MHIKIKKGLDLPISGKPGQQIGTGQIVRHVALVGIDYVGLKPTLLVAEGDRVKLGQPLFEHKKLPGVMFTAPGGGEVVAINRGPQRILQSVVIRINDVEEAVEFPVTPADQIASLTQEAVRQNLLASGLWTALRTRPYSQTPDPQSSPASIFITAIDTHPLAVDPAVVIQAEAEAFRNGLVALSRVADCPLWLCQAANASLPDVGNVPRLQVARFEGPHPAGLAGTHLHFVDPVSLGHVAWTINYQDVIAIGKLFTSGRLPVERIVAIAGPAARQPRLVRTRFGASLTELTEEELMPGNNRVISGSVFGGRTARGSAAYLGPYHLQVSCLAEGTNREFMHYMRPGFNKFSVLPIFISSLFKRETYDFDTSTNGGERAMVPIGNYEQVMPLDILPTQLLRSLIVGDTEMAQRLGALELDEEDLSLCTFVCAGKYEYGPILRDNLARIEKEG